jgi:hypothetical protein
MVTVKSVVVLLQMLLNVMIVTKTMASFGKTCEITWLKGKISQPVPLHQGAAKHVCEIVDTCEVIFNI